jgi:RNA polymerase sigma-70 factor (ECF subfamily)
MVVAAGLPDDEVAESALGELCRAYWYPLYAYVRRTGCPSAEAEDLTQEFFARLLSKGWLGDVDRAKGRFRNFLLAAMKHFLANEWRRGAAQKRGGGAPSIPLDALAAEERYAHEPADASTPETIYQRRWALTVLDQVLGQLRAEMEDAGKGEQFAVLKDLLAPDAGNVSYAAAGERLAMSEDAVKVAVYRLRKRYRDLLRSRIAATVESNAEIDEEIRDLFRVFAEK